MYNVKPVQPPFNFVEAGVIIKWSGVRNITQLEQLERHLMITHTIEPYWIPSQKKTKSKLQI